MVDDSGIGVLLATPNDRLWLGDDHGVTVVAPAVDTVSTPDVPATAAVARPGRPRLRHLHVGLDRARPRA